MLGKEIFVRQTMSVTKFTVKNIYIYIDIFQKEKSHFITALKKTLKEFHTKMRNFKMSE